MSNELVFKLRVDGAAQSATSISQVGEAVDQLGLRGPAAAAALDKLSGTFTASRSAQDAFVSGLRDQIALFGKTASEVERYRAAQLGVGAAAAPLILQLQNQRAAQEAAATAAREEAAALREAASAKKAAESAQASFVRNLQDQVAVQGKSQAEILRYRAAQLGVSKDAEQYIAAIEKSNKSTLGLSISAGQASAALRTLPAQFTDIATQLAGGQSPFLVLLQQGGQIKDSFGGIGNAAKALGSLLTPAGVAMGGVAAAAVVLALAYNQGAEESKAFNSALILSGNAAGQTRDQLAGLAQSVGGVVGTQGQAADALAQLAASGKVAGAQLGLAAEAAIRLQRDAGQGVGETVRIFSELGKEPLQASIKLNESTNYLTISVLEQIRALEQQGKAAEAAALAQNTYATEAIARTKDLEANLGTLERAWRDAKEGAASFWDAALGIGRADTAEKRIKELQSNLAQLAAAGQRDYLLFGSADKDRAELAGLQASKAAAEAEAKRKAEVAATTKAYIAATEANKKYTDGALTGAEKINKALAEYRRNLDAEQKGRASAGLPAISAAEIAKVERSIRENGSPKGVEKAAFDRQIEAFKAAQGVIRELSKQAQSDLQSAAERGLITQRELIEGRMQLELRAADNRAEILRGELAAANATKGAEKERIAIAGRLGAVAAEQAGIRKRAENDVLQLLYKQEKAAEAVYQAQRDEDAAARTAMVVREADARKQGALAVYEYVRGIDDAVAATELEQSLASKSQRDRSIALAQYRIELDLRRQIESINSNIGFGPEERASEVARAQAAAAKASLNAVTQVTLDEWTKINDQIGQSLTDALMQGGKSAWEYLKGLFRSTVLRPIIQGVIAPITGGLSTAANAFASNGGGAGGIGSLLGSSNSLISSITGGLTSSIASLVSGAGSLLGSSALSTFATGMQGSTLAAGLAGPTTAGASGILGAGASFASAVPYLAGALALFSAKDALFGRKLKDTSITGTLGGEAGFTGATEQFFKGGLFRSNKTETKALDAAVADPLAASVQAIKKTVADYAGALNLPAEQIASFTQSIKFSTKDLSPEQVQAKLQEALAGFGDALAGTFAGELGPFQATGEKAGQTLARLAGAISGVNPLLEQLGLKVFDVGLAGADAASQLAAQLGGLEGLSQTSSAYFQAYYSDAERAAKATEGITSVLGQVGLSLPATREEFRKLVEAQDLTTESGRNSFAALLKVSGAFAELTPAAEASAQAINAAAREQLAGAIDQNIGKFLSDTQRTAREYSSIAGSLSQAGVEVDIGKLIGLNKSEIFDLASAFVASADNTDAAKLAVVQAAGALADLKDQAAQAAQALDSQLASAIDANVDKFLTPRQSLERKAGAISGSLAAVGLNFSPEQLLGYSKDQIFDFAKSFVAATSNSQEAKIAVVEAAGALQDLAAALRDVKVNEFLQGLNLTADELLGAYRELTPAADNLVTAWRKSRTEMEALRDALAEIEGTKAVSALDQLRNTISQRDALKGVVGGIDSQLVSLRSGTGDAAALGYLRQREAALWKDFASTKNPAVAQAITDTTLQRIKLEGELQQQANASQITALKEQISAAERLRDVASQMGDFVLSLRAGSLSNLSAAGRQAAQQEILDKAIATGGDVQGAANALLQLGQQRFGGATAQYSQLFDETQAKLLAFGSSAAGADAQITEAQAQLNALTSVADNSLAQITALESLRTAFGAEVQTLDASVREQLAVQRSALDQMVLMVTNQERQIMQLGEGLTRIIDGVERTADAAEGGALSGAEAEAMGA